MNLDELKNTWQTLNLRVGHLEEENRRLAQRLSAERAAGTQQQLARRYRRLSVVGLLLPLLSVALYFCGMPLWFDILYAIFGLAMCALNLRLANFIGRSNYLSLPTVEAVAHAVRIRLWQQRLLIGGESAGLVVVIILFFQLADFGTGAIISGTIGGIVGGIVGYFKQRSLFRMSRRLLAQLRQDATSDDDDA